MSGILDYLKGIRAASVEKNALLEDLAELAKENSLNIGLYTNMISTDVDAALSRNNYFVKMATSRAKAFAQRNNDIPIKTDDVVGMVAYALNNADDIIGWLRDEVNKSFKSLEAAEGISYRKAVLMQYVDGLRFFERYASSLALILSMIASDKDSDRVRLESLVTQAEARFLVDTMDFFFQLLGLVVRPRTKYQSILRDVPDVVADDSNDAVFSASQAGFTRIDPLRLNFALHNLNPNYYRKLRQSRKLVEAYEAAKEAATGVELHLERLRNKRSGESDPAVDRAIQYHEDRLITLRKKIQQIEEDYDV